MSIIYKIGLYHKLPKLFTHYIKSGPYKNCNQCPLAQLITPGKGLLSNMLIKN